MRSDDEIRAGARIKFAGEARARWLVRARSERFIIATQVMFGRPRYTIIDLAEQRRGPDDRVFSQDYITDEDIAARLHALDQQEVAVSRRRDLPLAIEAVRSA